MIYCACIKIIILFTVYIGGWLKSISVYYTKIKYISYVNLVFVGLITTISMYEHMWFFYSGILAVWTIDSSQNFID